MAGFTVLCYQISQVVAGLLASTACGRVLTGTNWKCTSEVVAQDWMLPEYNDKTWPAAVAAAPHSTSDIHKVLDGISEKAFWIWTINHGYGNTKIDATVYCRVTLQGWHHIVSHHVKD